MQTKTNDDPLKKMSKSMMWDLGIAGASALGAAFGIPPSATAALGGAVKGKLYDEKNEAGYVDPNLIASQEAQYQDNVSNLTKPGKVLKPITSYYGEPKNLSALTYKKGLLMKTLSGVQTLEENNTLKKDGVVSDWEEALGKARFGKNYDPNKADIA
jgi:hypothetical protein